jgi:mediator of RNA polymerase II transcription subunit 6
MSTAANLPDFSPALGHRYMPPPSNRLKATESQLNQGSKEATPLPGTLTDSKKASSANINASNYLDVRLLEESLNITLKYGDEYMDENPITGQPGEFHLSTSGRKDKLMVPTATKTPTPSAKPTAPPTPLKTDIPPARKGSKPDKSPRTPGTSKPKRRKSKMQSTGSITPT